MKGILGRKIGMTQIFSDTGEAVPVTVVQAGPCLVVQRKTAERDGYEAVQIGLVEERPPRRVSQPLRGHYEKAGVPPLRRLAEFPVEAGDEIRPATRSSPATRSRPRSSRSTSTSTSSAAARARASRA